MQNGNSSYYRYLLGDDKALEELVTCYSDSLVRFAACFVRDFSAAEDIAEETFIALILRRKMFESDAKLRAYLFKICRNKCIDHLRNNRRLAPLDDKIADMGTEKLLFERDRDRILYAALERIPTQYRDALYLTYIEGFSAEECAGILKKSKKQLYNLIARAKISLRAELEKGGFHHENL